MNFYKSNPNDILNDQRKQEINNKLYFNIFTVINLTKNHTTNNPPNPPYINLNELIFKYNTLDSNFFDNEIKKFKEKLYNYSFYNKIKDTIRYSEYDYLINFIQSNNSATLIGSLEATESLQNIFFNNIYKSCFYNKIDDNIKSLIGNDDKLLLPNISEVIQKTHKFEKKYKDKYIKYKSKYLSLKHEMIKSKLI
jgi:hypothetical protein